MSEPGSLLAEAEIEEMMKNRAPATQGQVRYAIASFADVICKEMIELKRRVAELEELATRPQPAAEPAGAAAPPLRLVKP